MSQENVDTTRRVMEAVNRGDYKTAAAELGPELEIDDTDIPESTGADSFYVWLARWDQAWEDWRIEHLEIRPVGEDRTISLFKMIVRGKGSGIELTRADPTHLCIAGTTLSSNTWQSSTTSPSFAWNRRSSSMQGTSWSSPFALLVTGGRAESSSRSTKSTCSGCATARSQKSASTAR